VANALENSDSRLIGITLALGRTTITVSVTGGGTRAGQRAMVPVTPSRLSKSEEEARAEHGRGLLFTSALATRWGRRREGGDLT
jgi:hypothetical protein